ncbi:MAG: hypothetical protein M3Z21_13965 [Pseudomonadota bacterium]|nr:hypothetical protein [Pseudomonadota bacterium]
MPAIRAWSLWALRKLWRGFRWTVVFTLILLETPITCLLGAMVFPAAPILEWVAWMQPLDDPWRTPLLIGIPVVALACLAVGAFYRDLVGRIIPGD